MRRDAVARRSVLASREPIRIAGASNVDDPRCRGDTRGRKATVRRAPQPSRARVSPDQCRQARDILKWTPRELAEAAVMPWIYSGAKASPRPRVPLLPGLLAFR